MNITRISNINTNFGMPWHNPNTGEKFDRQIIKDLDDLTNDEKLEAIRDINWIERYSPYHHVFYGKLPLSDDKKGIVARPINSDTGAEVAYADARYVGKLASKLNKQTAYLDRLHQTDEECASLTAWKKAPEGSHYQTDMTTLQFLAKSLHSPNESKARKKLARMEKLAPIYEFSAVNKAPNEYTLRADARPNIGAESQQTVTAVLGDSLLCNNCEDFLSRLEKNHEKVERLKDINNQLKIGE